MRRIDSARTQSPWPRAANQFNMAATPLAARVIARFPHSSPQPNSSHHQPSAKPYGALKDTTLVRSPDWQGGGKKKAGRSCDTSHKTRLAHEEVEANRSTSSLFEEVGVEVGWRRGDVEVWRGRTHLCCIAICILQKQLQQHEHCFSANCVWALAGIARIGKAFFLGTVYRSCSPIVREWPLDSQFTLHSHWSCVALFIGVFTHPPPPKKKRTTKIKTKQTKNQPTN